MILKFLKRLAVGLVAVAFVCLVCYLLLWVVAIACLVILAAAVLGKLEATKTEAPEQDEDPEEILP